jgi:1-acyl-sn-glycerol-3-phosphate acyltransferase
MANQKRYYEGVNPKTGRAVEDTEFGFDEKPKLGAFYVVVLSICRALMRLAYPTKIEGRHYVPKTGGVIFAFTHVGAQDAVMSSCACRRPTYSLAKIGLFKNPLLKFIFQRLGCVPVDRSKRNSKSLDMAEDLLKNGAALIVYAEGTVNKKPEIMPLKFGAVSLAARANVPIVPVVSTGRYKLFRHGVRVEFTEPMRPNKNLEQANQALLKRLQTVRSAHIQDDQNKFRQSDGWLQVFLKPLLLGIIRLIYRPKVEGLDNLPSQGQVIIAANHKHDFDPFLILLGLPRRRVHFLAKHECIEWKVGRLINKFGVVFVDRQAKDKEYVNRTVLKLLAKQRAIGLFPEGTRNKTNKLLISFKFGAVSYAKKSGAPLVPAAIIGRYRPFRPGLKIVFGQPIKVGPHDNLEKANQKLYQAIEKMLLAGNEPAYRKEIYKEYKERNQKCQQKK